MKKVAHTPAIFYYQDEVLVPERNHAFDTQQWLYRSWLGKVFRLLLKTHHAARWMGWYQNTRVSKQLIASFCKEYQIIMNDFILPADGYSSFNNFFTRALKPGARQFPENPQTIVSPADGKLFVIKNVTEHSTFFVKELPFNLATFLGNTTQAQQLSNGTLCMFRLAPYDYHRFHAPLDGTIEQIIRIPGTLESVNPIAFMTGVQPLTVNERIIILVKTATTGTIAIVAVGALFVGSITLTSKHGDYIKRGDELGMFAFGGSTVVVLFPANTIAPKASFLTHSLQGYETAITLGTAITE